MAIKIFIDQGHNPRNPNAGAEGNGLKEQDVTYEVGRQLAALLRSTGNYEVLLSRNSPEEILGTSNASSLASRTKAAISANPSALATMAAIPFAFTASAFPPARRPSSSTAARRCRGCRPSRRGGVRTQAA